MAQAKKDPDSGVTMLSKPVTSAGKGSAKSLELISPVTDRQTGSDALVALIEDRKTRRHFSPHRANLLRACNIRAGMRVLEVGDGTGALARYLLEQGAQVTVAAQSVTEASMTLARCEGLEGLEALCAQVSDLPGEDLYDLVWCSSVPYGAEAYPDFMKHLYRLTAPGGTVAVAVENPVGLRRIVAHAEGRGPSPWGAEPDLDAAVHGWWTTPLEAQAHLTAAGFELTDRLYPFPDYQYPRTLVAARAFAQPDALKFIDQVVGNPLTGRPAGSAATLDDRSVHATLLKAGLAQEAASDVVLLATKSPADAAALVDPDTLAWHYGNVRLAPWRNEKRIVNTEQGRRVQTRAIGAVDAASDSDSDSNPESWLYLDRKKWADFLYGVTLEQQVLDGCERGDLVAVERAVREWNSVMEPAVEAVADGADFDASRHPFVTSSTARLLPGDYLDCTPANVMLDADGKPEYFDREWCARAPVDADMVRVRALWLLVHGIVVSNAPMPWEPDLTIGAITAELWRVIAPDVELTDDLLQAVFTAEGAFQQLVSGKDPEQIATHMRQRNAYSRAHAAVPGAAAAPQGSAKSGANTFLKELSALRRHLKQVRKEADAVLTSRRWKLGSRLETASRRALRRPQRDPSKPLRKLLSQTDQMLDRLRVEGASQERPYEMYEGYLNWVTTAPVTPGPLDEPGARVVGVMDSRRRQLMSRYAAAGHTTPVSVVIVADSRGPGLEEALASLTTQTYEHWQAVVVVDGGIDVPDPRVVCLPRATGSTHEAALNAGLKEASGVLVAYLDEYTTWHPDFLSVMVGQFADNTDATVAYCARQIRDPQGSGKAEVHALVYAPFNRSLLENRNYVGLTSVVHSADLVAERGGFNEALPGFADWELLLRYTQTQGALAVPCLLSVEVLRDPEAHALRGAEDRALPAQFSDAVDEAPLDVTLPEAEQQYVLRPLSQASRDLCAAATPRPLAVVIPSYEAAEYLQVCVESVLAHTAGDFRLIIVDNGSGDPVQKYLDSLGGDDRVDIIRNGENLGFTHAVNIGIEHAGPERDVVFLNNDAALTPGWVEGMWDVLDHVPDAGLVIPRQTYVPHIPESRGHVAFRASDREVDVTLSTLQRNVVDPELNWRRGYMAVNFAPFFCVYIPRETIAEVGPLNVEHGPHYRSDRMYCDMVRHFAGKQIVYTPHSKVYHFRQKATKNLEDAKPALFDTMVRRNTWQAPERP